MPETSIVMIGTTKNLLLSALVLTLSLTQTTHALAQIASPDTRSPVIELEAVAESNADNNQVFTAQVVDNRELKDVTLYYRRAGQQAFTPTPMAIIGDSAYYSATIETDRKDLRTIQYYVQARDEAGNRTVEGFAFDPYNRLIIANEVIVANPSPVTPVEAATETKSVQWWQIALGVVAVGALASLVSGGGDGDTKTDDGTVPLTVTVTGL